MKDEQFQKKLELMLERFEEIDKEVKKYFYKERLYVKNQDYINKSYSKYRSILDDKYKKENSST